MTWSRRSFLALGSTLALPLAHASGLLTPDTVPLVPGGGGASAPTIPVATPPTAVDAGKALPERIVSAIYPTQEPDLAREMVSVSHGNFARVRELVEAKPSLARAAWDWGFGDWETALGAASHMGNRPIAEFLIVNGARPSLFSAAMLGQLDVVKAFVSASAGVARIRGPHGITLLAHARAGKESAGSVVQYLEGLGDADVRPTLVALTPEQVAQLSGVYTFGPRSDERIEITPSPSSPNAAPRSPGTELSFTREGRAQRQLFHLGEWAFYPAGALAVRIRFAVSEGRASGLSIYDPDLVLKAERTA